MQLARIGEIGAMQNLLATKKFTANHRDEEGITPLHVCFPVTLLPDLWPVALTGTISWIVGSH